MPQVPQLFASLFRSKHWLALAHQDCPLGHRHVPDAHTWFDGHTVPQAPQFDASVDVSTQLAPQAVRPEVSQVQAP